MQIFKKIFLILSLILFCGLTISVVFAQDNSNKLQNVQEEIKELEKKLAETRDKSRTLSNQISYMDSQIRLTELQITDTQGRIESLENEIASLSAKIDKLELSLTQLSHLLLERISETYKKGKFSYLELLFSTNDFSNLLSRLKYIKIVQTHDKKLMYEIQNAKDTFTQKRQLREEKKQEQEELQKKLLAQKATLDSQKKDKEYLLRITKNDEVSYQQLLASARAELEAIQAIIAGKGEESEVGKVNEGDRIASIIQGSSCNSSGTHLHFMVAQNGEAKNPFDFLKGGIDYENCSARVCGSSEGDSFNPNGSWNWPVNPRVEFLQGYGDTWAIHHTWVSSIYTFHNGIDIDSNSSDIKAVKKGTLYRGSYMGGNGCNLRYVRVDHDDSDIDTYYLHINYVL